MDVLNKVKSQINALKSGNRESEAKKGKSTFKDDVQTGGGKSNKGNKGNSGKGKGKGAKGKKGKNSGKKGGKGKK